MPRPKFNLTFAHVIKVHLMRSFKLKDGKLSFDIQVTIIKKRLLRQVILCDVSCKDEEDGRKLGIVQKQKNTVMITATPFLLENYRTGLLYLYFRAVMVEGGGVQAPKRD